MFSATQAKLSLTCTSNATPASWMGSPRSLILSALTLRAYDASIHKSSMPRYSKRTSSNISSASDRRKLDLSVVCISAYESGSGSRTNHRCTDALRISQERVGTRRRPFPRPFSRPPHEFTAGLFQGTIDADVLPSEAGSAAGLAITLKRVYIPS